MVIKKIVLFIIGFAFVIGGIAMALDNWAFTQIIFRGVQGPVLAIVGLVVLAIAKD